MTCYGHDNAGVGDTYIAPCFVLFLVIEMMIALTVHWKGGSVPLKPAVNVALMAAPVAKTEFFTLWHFF